MKKILIFSLAAVLFSFLPVKSALAEYSPLAGDLIKGSSPAVYYVPTAGSRLAFPNEATYFAWYSDFSAVKTVSDQEIANLSLVGLVTIRPGAFPVKIESDPRIYGVARNGVLRAFATEAVTSMVYGTDWPKKVVTIPDAFFTSYSQGDDITAGGQYWWAKEKDSVPTIADNYVIKPPAPSVAPATPEPVVAIPASSQNPSTAVTASNSKKLLFVLFDPNRPADAAFDKAVFERVVFGSQPSVADYFSFQSNKHTSLAKAGILGWYQGTKASSQYWSDGTTDQPDPENDGFKIGQNQMVYEAMKDADKDFDFSAYDANNDKKITPDELGIFIVIPNHDTPTDAVVNVYSSDTPANVTAIFDGMTIDSVGQLGIGMPLGDGTVLGTVNHLVAKTVYGLTDLSSGVGVFSLMANPRTDIGLDPYNLIKLGWITPKVIPENIEVSSQDLISAGPSKTVVQVNRGSSSSASEYFLIENRERDVYDSSLPDIGIAVWNITSGGNVRLVRLDNSSTDDTRALWRQQNSSYSPTGLELHWLSDGSRSGVRLLNVGPADPLMRITLEKKILDEMDLRDQPSPIQ